jgi:hypothetical protein
MSTFMQVQQKYRLLTPLLNERQRRLWAAAEALALGHGGITLVAQATGLSRTTIRDGLRDLRQPERDFGDAQRRPGAGRPPLTQTDPTLVRDLERLIEPTTRGDPESPLRWTCKSLTNLAEALQAQGHHVGRDTVAALLRQLGYSLQGNRKTREGDDHPDRNAQFEYINARTEAFQARGQPVVSVDTKKKELVGAYKQQGREYEPAGEPVAVNTHDFPDPDVGKAIPYGVYDVGANAGWVSVGTDHDTAAFAVSALRQWWLHMGRETYAGATELLIHADNGGSNGSRNRLYKASLQALADELGLRLSVCHFPPGTSKWNKVEHRLFCHISTNFRGRPLTSHETVVQLIGATQTTPGLWVRAALDTEPYPTGVKVTEEEFRRIDLQPESFHGEWNYTIMPRANTAS